MNGVSKKRKREFSTFRRYVVHRPTSAFEYESKKLDTIYKKSIFSLKMSDLQSALDDVIVQEDVEEQVREQYDNDIEYYYDYHCNGSY